MRKHRLWLVPLFVLGLCFVAGVASAAPNLLKMPGASANFEDPLDYNTNPIAFAAVPGSPTRVRIAAWVRPDWGVYKGKNVSRPKPRAFSDMVIGLGMNDPDDANKVFDKDQAFEKMPIGRPVGDMRVEWEADIPPGADVRLNFPAQYADDYASKGAKIWKDNRGVAPLYIFVGGWDAHRTPTGAIYTENPIGLDNGYAVRRNSDGTFVPIGTGRVYYKIDDRGSD